METMSKSKTPFTLAGHAKEEDEYGYTDVIDQISDILDKNKESYGIVILGHPDGKGAIQGSAMLHTGPDPELLAQALLNLMREQKPLATVVLAAVREYIMSKTK